MAGAEEGGAASRGGGEGGGRTCDPLAAGVTLDAGQHLAIRAIQQLRTEKTRPLVVGVGGPSGSGKSSLVSKLREVVEGVVLDLCHYVDPHCVTDDIYDLDAVDMRLLKTHIQDLVKGVEVESPLFDAVQRTRAGFRSLRVPAQGVVFVKGVYALHTELLPLLDLRVAVVGGVHYNLLQKVKSDVQQSSTSSSSSGSSSSGEDVMDSLFPAFRTHIEPTLAAAQIRISNCFVADSLRNPLYVLKCKNSRTAATSGTNTSSSSSSSSSASLQVTSEAVVCILQQQGRQNCTCTTYEFLDVYLCPPGQSASERRTKSWIRVRQCGIRYFVTVGDQRVVDSNSHFIIRPRAEFEVGKTTLSGLLHCGYTVAASFARHTVVVGRDDGRLAVSLDRLKYDDGSHDDYVQIKARDREEAKMTVSALGLQGPWVTQSYVNIMLDRVGFTPRVASPPLSSSWLQLSLSSIGGPPSQLLGGADSPAPSAPATSAPARPTIATSSGSDRGGLISAQLAASGSSQPSPLLRAGGGSTMGEGAGGERNEWTRTPVREDADLTAPASWQLTGLEESMAMMMRTQYIQDRIASAGGSAPDQQASPAAVLPPVSRSWSSPPAAAGPAEAGAATSLPVPVQAVAVEAGDGSSRHSSSSSRQPSRYQSSASMGVSQISSSQASPQQTFRQQQQHEEQQQHQQSQHDSPRSMPEQQQQRQPQQAAATAVRYHVVPKKEWFSYDRGLVLAVQAAQKLLSKNGPPVIIGIGGPSGSGKSSMAAAIARLMSCHVITMESFCMPSVAAASSASVAAVGLPAVGYDEFAMLDVRLLCQTLHELRATGSTRVPIFDFAMNARVGFRDVHVHGDGTSSGVVVVEGSHALNPMLQPMLDFRISVMGGVHSHLLSRVCRELEASRGTAATATTAFSSSSASAASASASAATVEPILFPTFCQEIAQNIESADLKVRNEFDPIHSGEASAFVLKSAREVSEERIRGAMDVTRYTRQEQAFRDIFLFLPQLYPHGAADEGGCIRVRVKDNRCSVLVREERLQEGQFVLQPQVDFDVGVGTINGLLRLGYKPLLVMDATATLHKDGQLLIEVDNLTQLGRRFTQIKGRSRDRVMAAGTALGLSGTYTTQPFFDILRESTASPAISVLRTPSTLSASLPPPPPQPLLSLQPTLVQSQSAALGPAAEASPLLASILGSSATHTHSVVVGTGVGGEGAMGLSGANVTYSLMQQHEEQQQQQQQQHTFQQTPWTQQQHQHQQNHQYQQPQPQGAAESWATMGPGPQAPSSSPNAAWDAAVMARLARIEARLARLEQWQRLNTLLLGTILLWCVVCLRPRGHP